MKDSSVSLLNHLYFYDSKLDILLRPYNIVAKQRDAYEGGGGGGGEQYY